jgi:hypothetical protein
VSSTVPLPPSAVPTAETTRAGGRRPEEPQDRTGVIAIWAVVGIGVLLLVTQGWGRWILSGEEFRAVDVTGPDVYADWRQVVLRIVEALSVVEMSLLVYLVIVRPRLRLGHFTLDARITIGLLIGSFTDGILNTQQYLFAWNQHSINLGSWASFIPLNDPEHQSRYAEALIWGIPQYTYYCITVAMIACAWIARMRERDPSFSNVRAYATVFAAAFAFDFVLENVLIRVVEAYHYAKTPSELTLWAGSQYQFPLYESVLVASLGVAFTALKLSAIDHPRGLSFPERGVERLPERIRTPARWLAVIAFCFCCLFFIYHVPFQLFGLIGDSMADLPSYMTPND